MDLHRHRGTRVPQSPLRRLGWAGAIFIFGLAGSTYVSTYFSTFRVTEKSSLEPIALEVHPEPTRKVYPYSIVPGGVRTSEELRAATLRDPLVAEHYKDFRIERALLTHAKEEQMVYVSYRLGKRVLWTTYPVRLALNEELLTDGSRFIRTRCGNQISFSRQMPVDRADEPNEYALDFIPDSPSFEVSSLKWLAGDFEVAAPVESISILRNTPRVATPTFFLQPSPVLAPVTFTGRRVRPPFVLNPVPEPSTWMIAGFGLIFVLWISRRQLKYHKARERTLPTWFYSRRPACAPTPRPTTTRLDRPESGSLS